jgi:hypothetical protein
MPSKIFIKPVLMGLERVRDYSIPQGHGFSRATNDAAIPGFRWDETAGMRRLVSRKS